MSRPRLISVTLLAIGALFLNVSARQRAVGVRPRVAMPLNLERSFAITDPAVLAPFRFERVLNALTTGTTTTGEALFRQWWDTQNAKPGLNSAMPHCDDSIVNGKPAYNGFERRCPTPEGELAKKPFRPDDFRAIAVVNRFDLADAAGSHCGQYRVLFAGKTTWEQETFHVIFEGALPNPQPERGVEACRPVAQFWADLTNVDDLGERRDRLEQFFFDGIGAFAPVIHPDHYRHSPAGVRTIQRTFATQPDASRFLPASFFQFRLTQECVSGECRTVMRPDALDNLPPSTFFDANDGSDRARRFREVFLANVASLATPDPNLFFMNVPTEFLIGDSQPTADDRPFDFSRSFQLGRSTPAGRMFEARIEAELRRTGSTLRADDVIRRAETQTCAGCHLLGFDIGDGQRFPAALEGLQHVSDRVRYEEDTIYTISPAMRDVFIPHRMKILRDFIVDSN